MWAFSPTTSTLLVLTTTALSVRLLPRAPVYSPNTSVWAKVAVVGIICSHSVVSVCQFVKWVHQISPIQDSNRVDQVRRIVGPHNAVSDISMNNTARLLTLSKILANFCIQLAANWPPVFWRKRFDVRRISLRDHCSECRLFWRREVNIWQRSESSVEYLNFSEV